MWLVKCLFFNKVFYLVYKMCMKYLIAPQSGAKVVGVSISIRDLYGIVNIKGLIIIDYNIEIR